MVGRADTVLIRAVSPIQSDLYREVPLYCNSMHNDELKHDTVTQGADIGIHAKDFPTLSKLPTPITLSHSPTPSLAHRSNSTQI